jgi:hypothetical protein
MPLTREVLLKMYLIRNCVAAQALHACNAAKTEKRKPHSFSEGFSAREANFREDLFYVVG